MALPISEGLSINIGKAIVAYCYLRMVDTAYADPRSFIGTYRADPLSALKTRLSSIAMITQGADLELDDIANIKADFYKLDEGHSMLCFNVSEYAGVFRVDENTPLIVPSFFCIVYDDAFIEEPIVFAQEPTIGSDEMILAQLLPERGHMNLGFGGECSASGFFRRVIETLGAVVVEDSQTKH